MSNILEKITESCNYVRDNSTHVKINYKKIDEIIEKMDLSENKHWLDSSSLKILDLKVNDVLTFLLVLHSIGDYCLWGDPKWEIETEEGTLDGSVAMIYLIAKRIKSGKDFNMSKEEFKEFLKGNTELPLLESRYNSLLESNKYLKEHNFYEEIKGYTKDIDLLNYLIEHFSFLTDKTEYKGKEVYFYKRAQLFTSDILHIREKLEKVDVEYDNLVGCADYKIPQVMRCFGMLEFDDELASKVDSKELIEKDSEYEIEIRANNIAIIDYISKKKGADCTRIKVNDYIWILGQDKSKMTKLYHRTLTEKY